MNSETQPVKHLKYIPALDGLRAVSILFVLFSHWILFLPQSLQHGGAMGQAGVNIFFVISGYLITSQLVAEKNRTGTISISRFMLRRSLRLMPASISVILAAVILNRLGIMPLTLG